MDGQMRLCLKVGHQAYNWQFLTIFDFNITFHRKNFYLALFGVNILSTTSHVTAQLFLHFDTHNGPKITKNLKSE